MNYIDTNCGQAGLHLSIALYSFLLFSTMSRANDIISDILSNIESPGEDPGDNTESGADGGTNTTATSNSDDMVLTETGVPGASAPDTQTATTTTAVSDGVFPETATITTTTATTSTTFTSESNPTITLASSDDDGSSSSGGGGDGLSNNTKIAIAVPVSIVGAIIIGAILFFLLRRRKRQQRQTQPVISTPQLETSSSVFLPAQIQPVPAPLAPLNRRPVPQGPPLYTEQPDSSMPADPESTAIPPATAAAAAAATTTTTRDLEWRTSEERGGGRSRSPFDHPHDNDADRLSIISVVSDREAMMRSRGHRDDDLSSVSSFEDDPHPTTNRGG
ncbi:hypothetical protein BDW59DRAFT_81233 [Aspergillus cavernicola]|uniref:Mid2 domain-containing protein n=1 Tax=Aspergillus cavernicola TaxID=176166 RepID=A0ABR4IBB6_9EURO